ncbi:hypothetical protein BJ979_002425 [Schumannella luteola]|uniref:Uncharacterized protein n=1 Tax=Schumannella luteola TaxID=472059 RepID=A0A852YPZ2_9MICO|nr:hypothetical protein [Schumannella luteola]NYG99799.1 hypothetical protein [Schumannella luteola]
MSEESGSAASTPAFTMVGADAPVCVDGVCEIPGAVSDAGASSVDPA